MAFERADPSAPAVLLALRDDAAAGLRALGIDLGRASETADLDDREAAARFQAFAVPPSGRAGWAP